MSKKLTTDEVYNANAIAHQNLVPALNRASTDMNEMASLSRLLLEYSEMLELIRQEFRGEGYVQTDGGGEVLIQVTKPVFVRTDAITRKALTRENPVIKGKIEYIPHEDAIEEIIATLRLCGINKITPITDLDENEILADLRAVQCKLAAVLSLKQVEWGLDKELMPLKLEQINMIIKDARNVAKNGQLLKALRSTIQRVEQHIEGVRNLPKSTRGLYE